jgi:hypothetical protein
MSSKINMINNIVPSDMPSPFERLRYVRAAKRKRISGGRVPLRAMRHRQEHRFAWVGAAKPRFDDIMDHLRLAA